MDHKKVAETVIEAVGRDNLVAAAHCATRLRLVLKDDSKVNMKMLDSDPDIKGTFKTNGQFQIIIGPGDVNNVYDELIKMTGLSELSTDDLKQVAQKDQKFNPVMAFIKLLSAIFVPIIPALVAGGLLMALNNFLTSPGLFGAKSVVQMAPNVKGLSEIIQVMSAAPFIFMPILVGMSAAKRFGANQFLGATIGMIMTTPALGGAGKFWDIFGLHVSQTNYQYQVIPVLVAVWLLAFLEKRFHKWLPSAVDFTFTPLLSIMITGFLTFTIIGPVFKGVSDAITAAIVWLYNTTGAFGMGIFGLSYSAIVTTGLHQSFPAVETQLLAEYARGRGSGDFIFVTACMANVAQGAATFAVYFLTKNEKVKGLASSSGVSALLGITEPAMFGVNLKLKYPFIGAICGSAVGSAWIAGTKTLASAVGTAGIPGFISIPPESWGNYGIGMVLAIVVAFIVTCILHKRNVEGKTPAESENLAAPMKGNVAPITECPDPTFASKAMGDGFVVFPEDGKFYAPANAEVTMTFPTKHAFGLMTNDGTEILIHIGLDTVELNGEPFTMHVKKGDKVKKGQLLVDVDLKAIEAAGKETATAVVITNGKAVNLIKSGAVDAKTDVVEIANPVVEVKAA